MTATPSPTWWEEHDAHLRELAADPIDQWADPDPPFSDALLALLAEVESAFVRTGADTPPWPDPHLDPDGEMRDSSEEEYSRCLEPGKYRILGSRLEAWTEVLTARGWATREDVATGDLRSGIRWATPPPLPFHRTTVLRPRRPGAQPLILARTAPDDAEGSTDLAGEEARIPGLVIGIGDPVVLVSTVPDCGCDACDSGSQDLLEPLDRTLLSIVDGSFETVLTPDWTSWRTSFGAEGGSGEAGSDLSLTLTAQPWADGWVPRSLSPAISGDDYSAVGEEMWRERPGPLPLDALIDVLPPPLAARIHRLRPAHTWAGAPVRYVSLVEHPVTVPLDALENPPDGYRRDHRSTVVTGIGFEHAVSALRSWTVHRRAGLRVTASRTPQQVGAEVRLHLGRRPLRITAPCRVVEVVDEPDRVGFAYATLPGHPESGIEQFTLTRTGTGLVRFHLDVVSRPATWYARLGAPVARLVQELITRRYLRALSVPPPC